MSEEIKEAVKAPVGDGYFIIDSTIDGPKAREWWLSAAPFSDDNCIVAVVYNRDTPGIIPVREVLPDEAQEIQQLLPQLAAEQCAHAETKRTLEELRDKISNWIKP